MDSALGGLRAGRLLLVATAPGQGKTTYAVQIAATAALTDRRVRLHCPRETNRAVAARLMASSARVSYERLLLARPLDHSAQARAQGVRERLMATQLDVRADEPVDLSKAETCEVLIVDDAHLAPAEVRGQLLAAARSGVAVLATIPLDLLVRGPVGVGAHLDRDWTDMCDHAVAFVWPSPDHSDRAGEAELFLLKNRHGPLLQEVVVFQGAFARYVDLSR